MCLRFSYLAIAMHSVQRRVPEKVVFSKKDSAHYLPQKTVNRYISCSAQIGRSNDKRTIIGKGGLRIQDDREQSKETRKQMNDEAFKRWIKNKQKEENEKRKVKELEEKAQELQRIQKQEHDKRIVAANRERWLQKKLAAQQAEKKKKKKEEEKQEENEVVKKNLSKEVVSVWMGVTQSRPKPISSNIFRPSKVNVSYINPQPWRGVLDD